MIVKYNGREYTITDDTILSLNRMISQEGGCGGMPCSMCIFQTSGCPVFDYDRVDILNYLLKIYNRIKENKEEWEE